MAKRKGTQSEVIDDILFRDPFGQGARKCLGARIATLEIQSFVTKFVSK